VAIPLRLHPPLEGEGATPYPRRYAEARRLEAVKSGLRRGQEVTRGLHDAGYGSSSRLYERSDAQLGMTPATYGRGGSGWTARGGASSFAGPDVRGTTPALAAQYGAYVRIFERLGLQTIAVGADVGMMGGAGAHEFMAPSAAGEDEIARCPACGPCTAAAWSASGAYSGTG